ncbi:MAG: hypothetical protein E7519_15930 [Ruminococcaceae bacterium]|nr:hypothetical protein [Oscillospiraceae bacterium]
MQLIEYLAIWLFALFAVVIVLLIVSAVLTHEVCALHRENERLERNTKDAIAAALLRMTGRNT